MAPFTASRAFRHFWISFQDTIIAAQSICTAADSFGLGSVYIGTVLESLPECRDIFELPEYVLPVVLICMGYPGNPLRPAGKLPMRLLIHNEKYQELSDEELAQGFSEKYAGKTLSVAADDIRIEKLREVCLAVHGESFADACVSAVTERGYLSPAQHRFGLHYRADTMPTGNKDFIRAIED